MSLRSKPQYETAKFVAVNVWIVVGAIVIGSAILNVFDVLAPVVEFLAVGGLMAFAASPIVNVLERHGVPRSIGALLALVVVIAIVAAVAMVLLPIFTSQLMELVVRLPGQLRALGDWLIAVSRDFQMFTRSSSWAHDLDTQLTSLANVASDYVGQLAGDLGRGVLPFISSLSSQLFILFLGFVLAYWFACDYPRIHREMGTIIGEPGETSYRFMVAILARSVGGYMRGTIITSIIAGVLAGIGFLIVRHPYAGLMGVFTGVFHIIPVIGPVISCAFAVLVALFYNPALAFWTLIISVLAQNISDNVFAPKIMQSSVSVHPAMSLTAIVVGSALMGPLGMVIAIPLCAALKGLFIFYFENATHRQIVSYDGALFKGTPYLDEDGNPVAAFDALGDTSFVNDSEIISEDVAPTGEAIPRPDELDNPWSKLASLQAGSTGMFRNPFASERGGEHSGDHAAGRSKHDAHHAHASSAYRSANHIDRDESSKDDSPHT